MNDHDIKRFRAIFWNARHALSPALRPCSQHLREGDVANIYACCFQFLICENCDRDVFEHTPGFKCLWGPGYISYYMHVPATTSILIKNILESVPALSPHSPYHAKQI